MKKIWNELQYSIPLQIVCKNLPLKDSYRLPYVSKDWHYTALKKTLKQTQYFSYTTYHRRKRQLFYEFISYYVFS